MPNQLLDLYRKILAEQGVTDDASDYDLTVQLGQAAEQSGRAVFDRFPDFAQEYAEIREANAPSLGGEVANAVQRSTRGLASTAVGGAALVTGSDFLRRKAMEIEQGGDPADAPTIASMEDIAPGQSNRLLSRDALRYAASQVGSAVPSLVEAGVTSAVGAAVGSAAAPGPGTLAGAGAGLLAKGAVKQSIRQLLRRAAIEGGESVAEGLVRRGAIKEATEEGIEAALSAGNRSVAEVVAKQGAAAAGRRGALVANTANSYGLNAGEIYNETDDRALSLGFGAISAIPDTILPTMVMKRLFPDVALDQAKQEAKQYVGKLAVDALKNTTIEGTTESFQEATKIVARNITQGVDPLSFTEADWKQIREAGVGGVAGGALVAPVTAIETQRGTPVAPTPKPKVEPVVQPLTPQVANNVSPPVADRIQRAASLEPEQVVARIAELRALPTLTPEDQAELQVLQALAPVSEEDPNLTPVSPVVQPGIEPAAENEQAPTVNPLPAPDLVDPAPSLLTSTPILSEETPVLSNVEPDLTNSAPVESTYQYTVQQPQDHPDGGKKIPGYVQIDQLQGDKNTRSTTLEALAKEGIKLPKVPEWLPSGQYTLDQITNAIATGPGATELPAAAPVVAAATEPIVQANPLPAISQAPKPFTFGKIIQDSSTIDFRAAPELAELAPQQLAKGIPTLIKGIFSREGNRSETTAALVFRAPDGHVVQAGVVSPQKMSDAQGKKLTGTADNRLIALQSFAQTSRKKGAQGKVVQEGGPHPALLTDVISAGYQPIAYVSFDAPHGKIFQSFATEQEFDASWAATEKSTGKRGGIAKSAGVGVQGAVAESRARNQFQNVEARINQIINEVTDLEPGPQQEALMNEYRELAQRQQELFQVEQSQVGNAQLPEFRTADQARDARRAHNFQKAMARLKQLGVKVDVFAKAFYVNGEARTGVTYSPFHIGLVVEDITSGDMANLVTLLHEGTHSLMARSNAFIRQRVINAAEATMADLRQQGEVAAKSTGVRMSQLLSAEDTLAESLAERLAADGIPDAPGTAQAIIRWVKDLYFRAAMAIQQGLGIEPSESLALRWVENQLRREMGGDYELAFVRLIDRFLPETMLDGVSRHEDHGGTPGGVVDFHDPVDLKQSQPSVDPTSLDGLAWNLQFQTLPVQEETQTEETGQAIEYDEAVARIEAAAIAEEKKVVMEVYTQMKSQMPFEAFWKLAGRGDLPDARLAKVSELVPGAETAVIGGPEMTKAMNDQAMLKARIAIEKMQFKALRRSATIEEQAKKASEKLVAQAQQVNILEQNTRDGEMHERIMRDLSKEMIKDTVRSTRRGMALTARNTSLAEAIREAEDLTDSDLVPENYQRFLSRMLSENISLFSYLREVANMDLPLGTLTVRDIVKEIRARADENPTLSTLAEDRPLMTVIAALARDNADQMDMIQLGRLKDTEQFLKIKGELDEVRRANDSQIRSMLQLIDQNGQAKGLAQRIRSRFLKRRAELRRTQEVVKKAADQSMALREFQSLLQPFVEEHQGKTGAYSEWTPGEGKKWTAMQLQDGGTWAPAERTLRYNPDGTAQQGDQIAHDLVQNAQWLVQNQDRKGQALYERIKRQTYELRVTDFKQAYPEHWRSLMDRILMPLSEEMAALGHASGARGKQMMLRWQFIVKTHWKGKGSVEETSLEWTKALRDAQKAAGIEDHQLFLQQVYDPVMYMLGNEPGLDEATAIRRAIKVARDRLPSQPTVNFNPALEQLVRKTKAVNDKMLAIAEENNVFVSDPRIGGALRRAISSGWLTNMRSLNAAVVQTVTTDMENAGWTLDFVEETKQNGEVVRKVAKATTFQNLTSEATADPDQLRQQITPLFTPGIISRWLEPFMNKPGAPVFSFDGRPISQLDVQQAWQDGGGDVVMFIDGLAARTGVDPASTAVADFRRSILQQMDGLFGMESKLAYEARQTRSLFDPMGPRAHLMMDARMNDLLPAEHVRFAAYDPASARGMLGLVAFHAAFGRNGESMVSTLSELKSVHQSKAAAFGSLQGGSKKQRMFDAKARGLNYRELEKAARNQADAEALQQKLEQLFGFGNQAGPLGDLRAGLEMLSFLTGQVVNNPKTGLLNLVSLADRPVVQRSLSANTVKSTAKAYAEFSKNIFGSLLEASGFHVMRATAYAKWVGEVEGRAFGRLPWGVAMSDIGKEGSFQNSFQDKWLIRPLRLISAFQRKGVAIQLGESREFARANIVPGVGGVINYLSQEAAVANGVANIQQFELLVRKGVDFYAANPDKLKDPNFRLSAADLGMGSRALFGSAGVFDYYRQKAVEYRVGNLEDIIREAIPRAAAGELLLTKEQALAVNMMSANELNLESSVNTRAGAISQNPILKYGMPLLGWPLQKIQSINSAMKTLDGQYSALAMLKTAGRIAMWNLPMGLAFSLWMDKYDEKILKKKSNMSGIDWQAAIPIVGPAWALAGGKLTAKQNILGMIERQAKAGNIYGLGGDLAAQIISPHLDPASGQRAVSLDQRVLAMSQFLALQQALTNYINQGNTATYASVYRQVFGALGGNGVLHAVDMGNNFLGLDNQEARMVMRGSAQAWLRSAAREVGGMELAKSGATGSPTPVTVWVREMQLAAMANDQLEFQQSYQKALAAAREMGKPDPERSVLASWKARDPLEVFRTRPTDLELARLYSAMDDRGKVSVRQAISLYNQFSRQIEPSALEKRVNRMQARQRPPTAEALRRRALNVFDED